MIQYAGKQTMTIAEESAWDDCMRHRSDQPVEAAMPALDD